MAKDFIGKKNNSHMNGFGNMDIGKGHKHMGKIPMMGDSSPLTKKNHKKSEKKEDSFMKTDFDKNMEESE